MKDSKPNRKPKFPAIPWRIHLLVGGVGLIVIGIVVYAFYIGERLTTLDEPLLDAAMEIQLETEAADLWFREFIQGNMVVDIETIWQPLEQSVWYLHTILQSSKISKKFYSPLKDNDTRELIENVQQKLAALKKIIELIALTTEKSGSAAELRLGYEKAIKEFLDQVAQLEGRLLFIKAKNLRHFRYLHLVLIITSVVLLFSISLAFQFFVRRRKEDYQALIETKQGLEVENAERVRAETELRKAHQELEERVLRRTSELSLTNEKLIAEIAERCRVEKQLQQSKSMLQEVFDGIPDSLMLMDRHMDLKMINKSAAAYYKVEKLQDVTGKRCYQVAGKSTFCKGCRIHEAVMSGERNSFERKGFMNPERIEQVTIYPLEGNGDGSGDSIIRVIDITETRLFERQLIQSEKMASLGVMVSSVAHEINNPNNFISFNIPILKDYIKELIPIIDQFAAERPDLEFCHMPYREFREDIFKLMDNIKNGATRISSFVANLREFSQSDADFLKKNVDFKSVVEKVIAICGKKLKRSVKSIEMNIPRNLPQIYTAPHAIEQVLINLLINAAQAVDKEDSRVILNISIGSTPQEHLIVEIVDNGSGIDEASKDRLFDPFYTTRMANGGTGLGLYVCHNLIKGLGGRIEVQSQPGQGSKFTVILPHKDSDRPPAV
jgi:C4-dicarboxylate-specific signal transduction histidine kinase